MKKRVLLLAVSCREGGLCPGGIDLDNPQNWIRIVKNDGVGGSVQGHEIAFARPLDVIEFDGRPMPQGKQKENWVIDNNSCVKKETRSREELHQIYNNYGYHGFWNNLKSSLSEEEFERITEPSESILKVSNIEIYRDDYDKAKIDFDWTGSKWRLKWISMTDQDFYTRINNGERIHMNEAYIVISIPKDMSYTNPHTGQKQAFKFVSRVFEI